MGNSCFRYTIIESRSETTAPPSVCSPSVVNPDEINLETDVSSGHPKKMSNHYTVNYPNHEKRTSSTLYNKTHHELCHIKDMGCFICGKTHKKDGIATETHHFFCEWAGQNGVDWIKFGQSAKMLYNPQTGENIGNVFNWSAVSKNPTIFVDSPQNMIVLCKEHHISGNRGIHHVPFPEWILQKFAKPGVEFLL